MSREFGTGSCKDPERFRVQLFFNPSNFIRAASANSTFCLQPPVKSIKSHDRRKSKKKKKAHFWKGRKLGSCKAASEGGTDTWQGKGVGALFDITKGLNPEPHVSAHTFQSRRANSREQTGQEVSSLTGLFEQKYRPSKFCLTFGLITG